MQVELDAFSGRPNPRWELAGSETTKFAEQLRDLKPSQNREAALAGLGYRGFVLREDGEEIRIYHGFVIIKRGNHEKILNDANRKLERWLLDSARGHVDKATLQYVESELARE